MIGADNAATNHPKRRMILLPIVTKKRVAIPVHMEKYPMKVL